MRFSFAHEMGHYFLHDYAYISPPSSPDEWVRFLLAIPEQEYKSFEWQANEFAGRLIVPRENLETQINNVIVYLRNNNLTDHLDEDPHGVLSRVSPMIAKHFEVTTEVIEARAIREGLWPP